MVHYIRYTVKTGDTLWKIARMFDNKEIPSKSIPINN